MGHFGLSSLSHTDNALEPCALLTPLHIVPEWYFLCQYAMLKAVPKKNAGFIILLTSILILFLLGEVRNLTTLSLLPLVNNCFSLSFFFQSFLSFLWIGAQFPQVKFLSYARILTLYYYFLLMCILFSCNLNFIWKFVGLLMTDDRNEEHMDEDREDRRDPRKVLVSDCLSSDHTFGLTARLSFSLPTFLTSLPM